MSLKITKEDIERAKEMVYKKLNYYEVIDSYKYKTMNERMNFGLLINQEVRKELGLSDKIERTFHLTRMKGQDLK